MRARILVTGGAGQLARALSARLGGHPLPGPVWIPPEDVLDITDPAKVRAFVRQAKAAFERNTE